MNREIEWVRALHLKAGLPVRGEPPEKSIAAPETMAARRALRTMSDGLRQAMSSSLPVNTARGIGATMIAAAGPLVAFGLEPTFEEFLDGAQELIVEARKVMDDGLTAHDWAAVKKGACMLGTVCMGISSALSFPYEHILAEIIKSQMEERPDSIAAVLIAAGIALPAANDEGGAP